MSDGPYRCSGADDHLSACGGTCGVMTPKPTCPTCGSDEPRLLRLPCIRLLRFKEDFVGTFHAAPAPEHVCGLQGFGAPGDECPACTENVPKPAPEPTKPGETANLMLDAIAMSVHPPYLPHGETGDVEKALREALTWASEPFCMHDKRDNADIERRLKRAINRLARAAFEAGKAHAREEEDEHYALADPDWLPKEPR